MWVGGGNGRGIVELIGGFFRKDALEVEEKNIFIGSLFTPPCELWGRRATYRGTEWILG